MLTLIQKECTIFVVRLVEPAFPNIAIKYKFFIFVLVSDAHP